MEHILDDRNELVKDVSNLRYILGFKNDDEDESSAEEESFNDDDDDDWYIEDNPESSRTANETSAAELIESKINSFSSLKLNLEENVLNSNDNLELCFSVNQSYQKSLIKTIELLETMLDNNREQQEQLQEAVKETSDKVKYMTNRTVRSKTYLIFEHPYFKDICGDTAPLNEDAIIKQKNKEITAYVVPCKTWSDNEKEELKKAVASNSKEKLLEPLLLRKSILQDKLNKKMLSDKEQEATVNKLKEINAQISTIEQKPRKDCIGPKGNQLDWMKISVIGLNGLRTPEECELLWNNYIHPSINRDEWTHVEDKSLLEIAKKHQHRNWDTITCQLHTNRTSWQCLQRYRELSENHARGPWTKAEDEFLKEVVESCSIGNFIPWHQVSYYLEGRTRVQIQDRWKRTLCPEIRKGQWSMEEDLILVAATQKHGNNWKKFLNIFPVEPMFSAVKGSNVH